MTLPSKVLWEVRSTATSGYGVFASSPIPRGTRIFSEQPLLSLRRNQSPRALYPSSLLLSPTDLKWVLSLSTVPKAETTALRLGKVVWWSAAHVTRHLGGVLTGREKISWGAWRRWSVLENLRVLNVFRNNSFDVGGGKENKGVGLALFKGISRINHSCVPNSQGNWNAGVGNGAGEEKGDEQGRFNVHATRDIKVGEEVTVSYLPERCMMRQERVSQLGDRYGFECACEACDLKSKSAFEGEKRREDMRRILDVVMGGKEGAEGDEEYDEAIRTLDWDDGRRVGSNEVVSAESTTLRMLEKFVWTLEKSGVAGREVASLYAELARLYAKEGKHKEALKCAKKGLLLDEACLGVDHPGYLETAEAVKALVAAELAARTKKGNGTVLKAAAKTSTRLAAKISK